MGTITNARDVILQASALRVLPVLLTGSLVDFAQVVGDSRPVANADVTAQALNTGMTVNQVGGGMTLDTAGQVSGGQTAFNTGTGFWLGYADTAYQVSLGDPSGSGQYLTWDGSALTLAGSLDYAWVTGTRPTPNADNTADALSAGTTTGAGGWTLTGGSVRGGQTGYASGSGFFLGWEAGVARVSLGSGSAHALLWDGAVMQLAGRFAGRISTGSGRGPYGGAFDVADDGQVYAEYLRAEQVNATNINWPSSSPIYGVTLGNTSAVMGVVRSDNTAAYAHGVRGANNRNGAGGVVGAGNGYDFYADGAGTNYGPFTGTHDALVANGVVIAPGSIVMDQQLIERSGWSSTIFEVELSSAPNQAGAIGVVCAPGVPLASVQPTAFIDEWLERPALPHEGGDAGAAPVRVPRMKASYAALALTHQRLAVNALGEGQVLVCNEGGDLARGDLIVTSSSPGVGMRQGDDVLRAVTVARSREAVVFEDNAPRAVACIYLCG